MNSSILRIATRKSALALWQAEHVAAALRSAHPGLRVELLPLSTRGDEILDWRHHGEALTRKVNHATLHRGQVMSMLRQLGVKPPATDLIFYYRDLQ